MGRCCFMLTTERFFMPAIAGITCQAAQRSPRVIRILGVPGTAREWAEDLGAVVAGLAFVVLAGAILALVGR